MLEASARAVTSMVNVDKLGASLVPQVHDLRTVSATVAVEVAKAAIREGVARAHHDDLIQAVHEAMWQPRYSTIRPVAQLV